MRLTCPKCDARYEVAAAAIPTEGRDVQCSGCGHTWFQPHPDHPQRSDPPRDGGALLAEPAHRELDPAVIEILRQEAERETRLRALERSAGLESQPDLGLDFAGPGAPGQTPRPSGGARPAPIPPGDVPPQATPATAILGARPVPEDADETHEPAARSRGAGGFVSGFGLVAAAALALVLIYVNAGRIARSLPQIAPVMEAYVAKVDRGRIWLDDAIASYTPKPPD